MSSVNLTKATRSPKLLKNIPPFKKPISQMALLLPLLLNVANSQATTLTDAIMLSLEKNLALKSITLATQASSYDNKINFAKFLPTVSLSANTTWTEGEVEKLTENSQSQNNTHGYSASLNQTLFSLKDIFSQRTSHINTDMAQLRLQQSLQQTIETVAVAYFDVLRNHAQEHATQAELNSANARYKQISRNVELGNIAGRELYEVLAQKEQVANELRNLQKDKKSLIRKLENLTQHPVKVNYDLSPNAHYTPFTQTQREKLEPLLLGENIDILLAQKEYNKNRNLYRESAAAFTPTITGSISYNHNDSNVPSTDPEDTGLSNQAVYSLSMNLPLFNGGSDVFQLKKNALQIDQAKVDLHDTSNTALTAFNDLISNINNNSAAMQSLAIIIQANHASYTGMQKAYSLGTRTITDLLAAESKLYKSIRDYENSKYSYVTDLIGLEKLLGQLSLATIERLENYMVSHTSLQNDDLLPLHIQTQLERMQ